MQVAVDFAVFTCVCCPLGCEIEVAFDEEGRVAEIAGNTCARGAEYAAKEAVRPERTVTVVVPVGGCLEPASAKTARPVPKDRVRDVLAAAAALRVDGPVDAGDVLVDDAGGTGVPLIATKGAPETAG